MGGTSCDVCVIDAGVVRETDRRAIAGRPLALPSLDIETVGAGGGSIGWRDAGGALRVGPRSAGAVPGPGGLRARRHASRPSPTPTSCSATCRATAVSPAACGSTARRRSAAVGAPRGDARASTRCAPRRGSSTSPTPRCSRALRTMTVARGIDPRGYALLPFGGAGPLHATAIAEELGIERILCPRACGVLSALGLAAARAATRRDGVLRGGAASSALLEPGARRSSAASRRRERVRYALRYRGQSFELAVDAAADAGADELRERFEAAHERELRLPRARPRRSSW